VGSATTSADYVGAPTGVTYIHDQARNQQQVLSSIAHHIGGDLTNLSNENRNVEVLENGTVRITPIVQQSSINATTATADLLLDQPAQSSEPMEAVNWRPFTRNGIEGYIKPIVKLYTYQVFRYLIYISNFVSTAIHILAVH
jgi:hypothetical protein